MQGKGQAQPDGGSQRTDGGGPAGTEVLPVHIPPVPEVGGEKGGENAQLLQLGQLAGGDQLGVDHHRTDVPDRAVLRRLGSPAAADELGAGRVPVTVGQKLHPF